MPKTKVVTICGSTRFIDIMAVCSWLIERDENAITMGLHLLPYWYSKNLPKDHLAEHENVADEMDALHLRKIDLSDEIFVVDNDCYIGKSTTAEIEYAKANNKIIRYYTLDVVGEKVRDLILEYSK